MIPREWALIAFTILTQMAVGSFLVLGVVHAFSNRVCGTEETDKLSDRALLAIGPVLVLGLLASLLHLGSPLKAYSAVSNVATSWLSREILLTVIFFVLGGIFALMQWKKVASFPVRNIIAWIAALVGIGVIFSMSMVYQIEAQPAWNTIATPIAFFNTSLLLGTLAIAAAFVASYAYLSKKSDKGLDPVLDLLRASLRWIAIAAVVLLGVEFVITPMYMAYLSAGNEAAVATAQQLVNEYYIVFALRLILAFVGAGILALFLYQNASSGRKDKFLGNLAYSAFLLVLVAEVLGRYMFYMVHVRVGV